MLRAFERTLVLASVLLMGLVASTSAWADAGAERERMLVLSLKVSGGFPVDQAKLLDEVISVEVAKREVFDVLSDADVRQMLELEAERQAVGCDEDSSCLADVAGAMGARYVLAGRIGQLGSRMTMAVTLYDSAEASSIWREVVNATNIDGIADAIPRLVDGMIKTAIEKRGLQAKDQAPSTAASPQTTKASATSKEAKTPTKTAAKDNARKSKGTTKGTKKKSALPPPDPQPESSGWSTWTFAGIGSLILCSGCCSGCAAGLVGQNMQSSKDGRLDVMDFVYTGWDTASCGMMALGLGTLIFPFVVPAPADKSAEKEDAE